MRLWSIHPKYLDWMGLGALWREGILAQAVLAGETRGWRNHPQLDRFRDHPEPMNAIGFYLLKVWGEASARGYSYNLGKIRNPVSFVSKVPITIGQLCYEYDILLERTLLRTPFWHAEITGLKGAPEPHPLFYVVEGDIGNWEAAYWRGGSSLKSRTRSHHEE